MDKDEQIQVERYLDGQMTEAEIAAFEQQLQGSETLRETLEEERMVRTAMQRLREQELRAKLKQWRQKESEPTPSPAVPTKKRFGWRFWLALVAASLLLFWAYRVMSGPGEIIRPKDDGQHIQEHYSPDTSKPEAVPIPIATKEEPLRSTSLSKKPTDPLLQRLASIQKLLNSDLGYIKSRPLAQRKISTTDNPDSLNPEILAAAALEMGQFDKALQYLAQLDGGNSEVRNMKAHALFGAKQYTKAAEEFRALANNSHFGADAQWNIVMCYFAQYPDGQEAYRREIEQMLQGKSKRLQQKATDWQKEVRRFMSSPSK